VENVVSLGSLPKSVEISFTKNCRRKTINRHLAPERIIKHPLIFAALEMFAAFDNKCN